MSKVKRVEKASLEGVKLSQINNVKDKSNFVISFGHTFGMHADQRTIMPQNETNCSIQDSDSNFKIIIMLQTQTYCICRISWCFAFCVCVLFLCSVFKLFQLFTNVGYYDQRIALMGLKSGTGHPWGKHFLALDL